MTTQADQSSANAASLTTRTGLRFDIRPACPDDEAALGAFFRQVTPEDRRFRFLTGLNEVSHDLLERMTHVDHDRSEHFLALADDGETIIASAMLAADPDRDRAEVAISIRPDYKSQGMGWTLLDHCCGFAQAKGIRTLQSIESHDNHDAIQLEREMGFVASEYEGDPTLVLVQKTFAD